MKSAKYISSKTASFFQPLPAWKGSLILFGILIIIVLSYFLWQVKQLEHIFLNHSLENSKILANVIEQNAKSAVLSQETVEKIIRIFLGNTARFVDYLDSVEEFSSDELSEFALESGLAGIKIIRENGKSTQGPENWADLKHISCQSKDILLKHLASDHIFLLTWPRIQINPQNTGCIILGLEAAHIEKLHEQIGINHLLKSLSSLSGIEYVKIEQNQKNNINYQVIMKDYKNTQVAETRLSFDSDILVLGMDTRHLSARTKQLWNEFFFFSAVLAFLGILFSWIFHQSQTKYLFRIREIERELARQREDAALGRSASAIAHEIRNPLNAIGMGLQRLQIEADMSNEYQQLVSDILQAVQRTNGIISNIRQYAMPLKPDKKILNISSIINHILSLYHQKCIEHSIAVNCHIKDNHEIIGDSRMLEQVIDNLVKNAIEAQLNGGFINIFVNKKNNNLILCIENKGFKLKFSKANRILEPYFTTKTRGTGLGLSIVSKIIHAHNGKLELDFNKPDILKIIILLPLA